MAMYFSYRFWMSCKSLEPYPCRRQRWCSSTLRDKAKDLLQSHKYSSQAYSSLYDMSPWISSGHDEGHLPLQSSRLGEVKAHVRYLRLYGRLSLMLSRHQVSSDRYRRLPHYNRRLSQKALALWYVRCRCHGQEKTSLHLSASPRLSPPSLSVRHPCTAAAMQHEH